MDATYEFSLEIVDDHRRIRLSNTKEHTLNADGTWSATYCEPVGFFRHQFAACVEAWRSRDPMPTVIEHGIRANWLADGIRQRMESSI